MIEKYLQRLDEKFTDQWWASTQGYNDKRNEAIEAFLKQSLTDYGNEIKERFIESLPFNILLEEKTDCIDLRQLVKDIEIGKELSTPLTEEEWDQLNH